MFLTVSYDMGWSPNTGKLHTSKPNIREIEESKWHFEVSEIQSYTSKSRHSSFTSYRTYINTEDGDFMDNILDEHKPYLKKYLRDNKLEHLLKDQDVNV